jgi:hypothetical protein
MVIGLASHPHMGAAGYIYIDPHLLLLFFKFKTWFCLIQRTPLIKNVSELETLEENNVNLKE